MLYAYIFLGAGILILSILFRLAAVFRLTIPLLYALVVPTLLSDWYYAHYTLATGTLVGLCPGLDLRPQFQGDLAQLPFVQVAAALLGIQRPLLGLQQIVKGKHRHLVGQVVPGANLLAVVAIYDNEILIDDDGRIAAVLQDVLLQRGKLLPAERREQLRQIR